MRSSSAGFAAASLVLFFLFSPAGARAGERRGAELVVTRLDRSRVSGELIAVKPNSLLLLSKGTDVSVGLGEVLEVRIVRRAPTVLLTAAGFLLGSGIVGMTSEPADEWGWAGAYLAGAAGAAGGLASGLIAGADRWFPVAGESEAAVAFHLDRLRGLSREGRLGAGRGPSRRPRLRLGLGTTMGSFSDRWRTRSAETAWHFAEDVPPEEAGPQITTFYQRRHAGQSLAAAGPVSIGWEWTERWISEIELFMWGRGQEIFMEAAPSFVSTADGRTYTGFSPFRQSVSIDYVLIGMAYRPVVPSSGRKASLEVGIAAGPAWVRLGAYESLLSAENKTALAGRVQAVYDYSFTRSLSLGVYAGYRFGRAAFSGATVTQALVFRDWNGGVDPAELTRQVEMNVPPREFSQDGLIYGLRLSLRI